MNNLKTISIGDIHGDFKIILEVLLAEITKSYKINEINFKKDDMIIASISNSSFINASKSTYNENVIAYINDVMNRIEFNDCNIDFEISTKDKKINRDKKTNRDKQLLEYIYDKVKNVIINDNFYLDIDLKVLFKNKQIILLGDTIDASHEPKADINNINHINNLFDCEIYGSNKEIKDCNDIKEFYYDCFNNKTKINTNTKELVIPLFKYVFEILTFKMIKYLKDILQEQVIIVLGNHDIAYNINKQYDFIVEYLNNFYDFYYVNNVLYSHYGFVITNCNNNSNNCKGNCQRSETYDNNKIIFDDNEGCNKCDKSSSNCTAIYDILSNRLKFMYDNEMSIDKYDNLVIKNTDIFKNNYIRNESGKSYKVKGHSNDGRNSTMISLDITMSRFKQKQHIKECYERNEMDEFVNNMLLLMFKYELDMNVIMNVKINDKNIYTFVSDILNKLQQYKIYEIIDKVDYKDKKDKDYEAIKITMDKINDLINMSKYRNEFSFDDKEKNNKKENNKKDDEKEDELENKIHTKENFNNIFKLSYCYLKHIVKGNNNFIVYYINHKKMTGAFGNEVLLTEFNDGFIDYTGKSNDESNNKIHIKEFNTGGGNNFIRYCDSIERLD